MEEAVEAVVAAAEAEAVAQPRIEARRALPRPETEAAVSAAQQSTQTQNTDTTQTLEAWIEENKRLPTENPHLRVRQRAHAWAAFTEDKTLVQVIEEGVRLKLTKMPTPMSARARGDPQQLKDLLDKMVERGVVRRLTKRR